MATAGRQRDLETNSSESRVDVKYFQQLAGLFASTQREATVEAALEGLHLVGVNVRDAKAALEMKKSDTSQPLPANVALQTSLAIHSYTVEPPGIFSKVSKFLNDRKGRVANGPEMQGVMPWYNMVDHSVEHLPDSYTHKGDCCGKR